MTNSDRRIMLELCTNLIKQDALTDEEAQSIGLICLTATNRLLNSTERPSQPGKGDSIRWSLEALLNEYEGGVDTWVESVGVSEEDYVKFCAVGAAIINLFSE